MSRYPVLIADDHPIIRDGLRKILADTEDFVVAGEASSAMELLEALNSCPPATPALDLLIMDLSMPGRSGVELIKRVHERYPQLPILVFTMYAEEQFAVRAIHAGASGYLTKEADSESLLQALRKIAQGDLYVSPRVAELLAQEAAQRGHIRFGAQLSDREFDVLGRLVHGESHAAIAQALSLSIKTVSSHKTNILTKLGLENQIDLVRYAIEHGLVELPKN